jgi:outer membrane lipoprotein-sorting protein
MFHRSDRPRQIVLAGAIILLAALACADVPDHGGQRPADLDATAIIDQVDRLLRGESSAGRVEMRVSTRRWNRTMTIAIWSKGTDMSLVRVLEPRREAGTATLMVGRDIWNYLPGVDRTIRVPSSMMMASWMGSHFTNDDLVRRSRLIDDYTIETAFIGERDGTEIYEFELTPRPDAAVVWGAVLIEVRSADLMPVRSRYYGEDGELRRTMTFSDYREMGGRLVPTIMRMTPADRENEQTEMRYHELEFDIEISEDTFSLRALR